MVAISENELQRRWQTAREAMRERKLDFLIAQSSVAIFDAAVRWFTDISVDDGYTVTVIIPVDDGITAISHGPMSEELSPAAAPGVTKRVLSPMLPTLVSARLHAEKVVEELAPFKGCRIGLVGMDLMSAAFFKHLTTHLTGAEFENATDLLDGLKAVKSEEEADLIRGTCRVQDAVFSHILSEVRVGVNTNETRAEVVRKSMSLGGDKTNVIVWVIPKGGAMRSPAPRVLENGDQVTLLIETNGPGGFWGELGRIITLGEPSASLREQFGIAQDLQKQALSMLRPGTKPSDIWDANNELLRKRDSAEERRIFAHGMGYDMVERPAIDLLETMRIEESMSIVVHPAAVKPGAHGWVCDNYLVTKTGASACLHKTEQKIFVV
jgi:Xaa-Pro aminopeptidase